MIRRHRSHTFGRPRSFVLLAVGAAVALSAASAQDNLGRGRITGQVVDEAGALVEGANIVAQSLQGTAKLEGVTDKRGHFAVAGLGGGRWRVTASKPGYADAVTEMNVAQLKANPPVALTLRKLTGLQGLQADKAGLSLIDQANARLDQGDYDGALALLQEFMAKYPDLYQVRLNVATAYVKKGDADRAETEFKGVLDAVRKAQGDYTKDKATAVRALSGLGELALKKGDMAAGQDYFSQALALSPEDEGAAYNVGEILFSNQRSDEAAKYFELAIKIKQDWPKPYYRLGFVYLNKGDYAKSLECFNKFVALDPAGPDVPAVRTIIATIEKMKK
ncbi:MAG TPA: tetratricopeptide repeat protein [Terriglobales bacterium]|nr:tetratricopeptide repeat protein [Terriglobales bacterium]